MESFIRATVNIGLTKGPLRVDVGVPLVLNIVPNVLPDMEPISIKYTGNI